MWAVGAVMRESDQASLLAGAVQLSRDGDVFGKSYYNYSRQFGSYWMIGAVLDLLSLDEVGADPTAVVLSGNLVASISFLAGIFVLLKVRGPRHWWEWVPVSASLFSPVILFSSPLLSSNLISAGFLCLLVSVMAGKRSKLRDWISGSLGFCAVAARADAVLVLPLIALLSVRESSLSGLFQDGRIWILGASALLALVVGTLISSESAYDYSSFFQPLVAGSFLFFGVGSAFFALVGMVCWLFMRGAIRRDYYQILLGLALIVPLSFYCRILFTPRHLMTTALVVLFFASFERGKILLKEMREARLGKLVFLLVLLATFLPMFFGIKLSSMRSGSLTCSVPTLYPTADGYWPMGCHSQFLFWLRASARRPIDHNQRVWSAWEQLKVLPTNVGNVEVRSGGLESLGALRTSLLRDEQTVGGSFDAIVFDSRSISKRAVSVGGGRGGDNLSDEFSGNVVLSLHSSGEEVLMRDGEGGLPGWYKDKYALRHLLSRVGGGDDYVLMGNDGRWDELRGAGPFRWFFFSHRSDGSDGLNDDCHWHFREVLGGFYEYRNADNREIWIARSALPSFFRLNNYGS